MLNPADPEAPPATSVTPVVPFTSGIEPETSIYSELTQTTSFVAAGLVTAAPTATTSPSNGTITANSGVAEQTGNAGVRNKLPALAVLIVGAVAFAL